MEIKVGVSNRHVHLKKEDLEILFGKNYELTKLKDLSQKGQFASVETVTIKTLKNQIDDVRVLGPIRSYTQIEISKTDSYVLGLNPPVRESGDIKDTPGITLIGPNGSIDLKEGVIIPERHIHLTNADLIKYNLDKNKTVKIKVNGEKNTILDSVSLKVDDSYTFELHLDIDDANACLINQNDIVEIIND